VVRLIGVFRHVANSRINVHAQRVYEGQMPEISAKGSESDFDLEKTVMTPIKLPRRWWRLWSPASHVWAGPHPQRPHALADSPGIVVNPRTEPTARACA
jgi:hypothetical protein